MKAIVLSAYGDPSVLQLGEREIPPVKDHEVLIKVAAAGINRPDVLQRKEHYPAPGGVVQDILGLEVSGIIEQTGTEVTSWKPGQEVCALLAGGGYAEYVAVDAGSCLPVPKGFSLEDAASLPEVVLTVWQNIFQIGNLKKDETVLIYGGSGGIGSMAIQLVNLFGANAWTVASTTEKIDYCNSLGAQKTVNYREQNLLEEFARNSVDLILDSVGGAYLNTNLDLLKSQGRMVYINAMEGKGELNIFKMMQKRIHITGSTLRARSLAHKKQLIEDAVKNAYPLIESKEFSHKIFKKFPIEEVVEAHRLMDSRDFQGKILLQF